MTIFCPPRAFHCIIQPEANKWPFLDLGEPFTIVQPEANTWPFSIISEPFTVSYNQRLIHDHFLSSKSLSLYHTTRGKYMTIFRPSRAFHCIVQSEANTWQFSVLQEPFIVSYNQSQIHDHFPSFMSHCIMQPHANSNTWPFSVLYEHVTVSYNQRLIHDHFPSSKSLSLYHTTRGKYMSLSLYHATRWIVIHDHFPSSMSFSLYYVTRG